MLWGENRGKWKRLAAAGSRTQDTSGLSRQCSATEPQQPDDHQPPQSSMYTVQMVLNAWRLNPEVSWVQLLVTAGFFTFLYLHLITSKFIYFQREARCFQHLDWENHSAWVLSWWRKFSGQPLTEFWRHILSSCQMCDWGYVQSNTAKRII